MRALARERDLEPSTIKRMIDYVTEYRDEIPEWEEILTPIEDHFRDGGKLARFTPITIGKFFGIPISAATNRFTGLRSMVTTQRFALAMASSGGVGLMNGENVTAAVDRTLVLIWIACGWVGLKALPKSGQARIYVGCENPEDQSTFRKRTPTGHVRAQVPVNLQRALDPESLKTLHQFQLMWQMRDSLGRGIVQKAQEHLPPLIFNALLEFVDESGSMQRFEQTHDLPARSAKVLLRIGLEQIAQYEEMRMTRISG